MDLRKRMVPSGWVALAGAGVLLVLAGFFAPWIEHPAAGLALTGFEIGEWIKFAPQVRTGSAGLNRAGFYWPATSAALGLAVVVSRSVDRKGIRWALLAGAALVALLPLPLIEEISSLSGIRSSWARFGLIAVGLLAVGVFAFGGQRVPSWSQGTGLTAIGLTGFVIVNLTFAAAEPIVEQLYSRLVDPGVGLTMVQVGQITLAAAGIWQLAARERKKAIPS